ncbi:MAG: hypothetical protein VX615_03745 [Planctomycetota bacterium]|nr:hypothetical protein [Planctomycetota bacterium]
MKVSLKQSTLFAINAVLLFLLWHSVTSRVSDAQETRGHRYIAVNGDVNGVTPGVVYILDTTHQELIAITWDHNENRLVPLGYRPIASDAASALRN